MTLFFFGGGGVVVFLVSQVTEPAMNLTESEAADDPTVTEDLVSLPTAIRYSESGTLAHPSVSRVSFIYPKVPKVTGGVTLLFSGVIYKERNQPG